MSDAPVAKRDLDALLRAALESAPGQAERVARKAFEPRPGALDRALRRIFEWQPSYARRDPLRSLYGFSLLLVVALCLAGFAVWLVLELGPERPPSAEETAARYTLTNRRGVLVVRRPDGGTTFLQTGERPAQEPPRPMMLIVRGEPRP